MRAPSSSTNLHPVPARRPRVLWATAVPPGYTGGGGHIRQAHLIAALAERAEVHLLVSGGPVDPGIADLAASVTALGAVEDDWSARPRWQRRARDVWLAGVSRQTREVAAFAPVRAAMADHVRAFDGEAVVVEFSGLASLIAQRDRARGQSWTVELHNLSSQMALHEAAVASGARQRWLYRRDAASARRWEAKGLGGYDRVVTVSEDDRRALPSALPVHVVPNGVDLRHFTAAALPTTPSLVFTGALFTGPNVDGARWLCTEILPLVRAAVPSVSVSVVGARPVAAVRDLADLPGVQVLGDAPSTVPHLHAGRVAVVPLRIGSGTRLKALEAMAAGRPVVGTSIGLAGLDLTDGRHALMADDAPTFADQVVSLLSDDALAHRLAGAARRLVEDRYDWATIGANFADMLMAPP